MPRPLPNLVHHHGRSGVNRGTDHESREHRRAAVPGWQTGSLRVRRELKRLQGRQRVLRLGALENLIGHCFRRLILLDGHGGLVVVIQPVIVKVRQRQQPRDDLLLLRATYCGMGMDANVSRSPMARSGDVWWMVKTTCPL